MRLSLFSVDFVSSASSFLPAAGRELALLEIRGDRGPPPRPIRSSLFYRQRFSVRSREEAMDRFLRRRDMELYLRVLTDFRALFEAQADPLAKCEAVRRHSGRMWTLGLPGSWFVALGARRELWDEAGERAARLICCGELLVPLGFCVVRRDRGAPDRETQLLVLSGRYTRLYVYDVQDDVLFLVAQNLEELARHGVSRQEFAYRVSFCTIPAETGDADDGSAERRVCRGVRRSPPPCRSRPGRETLIVFRDPTFGSRMIVGVTREIVPGYVELRTPGYGCSALRLVRWVTELRPMWPFAAMDDGGFARCWSAVTEKLCCRWYLLGALGYRTRGGLFHVDHVVVVDQFGAVYALLVYTCRGIVRRVADDLGSFFRVGMLKRVFECRRYECERQRLSRLETKASCPHEADRTLARVELRMGPIAEDVRRQHYAWLKTAAGGVPYPPPWDLTDPNVSLRRDVYTSDDGRPFPASAGVTPEVHLLSVADPGPFAETREAEGAGGVSEDRTTAPTVEEEAVYARRAESSPTRVLFSPARRRPFVEI